MTIAPVGPLSAMVHNLRLMVADSDAFQVWVGAANAHQAMDRVWAIAAPPVSLYPWALVEVGDFIRQRTMVFAGSQFEYGAGTHLMLTFRGVADGDEPDAGYAFMNAIGGVIEDLEAMSGNQASPYQFTIPAISTAAPPQRIISPTRSAAGDFYEASFIIQKGVKP